MMSSRMHKTAKGRNIEKTLTMLTSRREAPKIEFVMLLTLYVVTSYFVRILARSETVIMFGGNPLPLTVFAGVLSSLANICIIFLVVFCGKSGYYTALAVLLAQFPSLAVGIFVRHNLSSIQGVFTNLFAIIAIVAIHMNNLEIEKVQKQLRDQATLDSLTGLPNRFACSKLLDECVRQNDRFGFVSIDLNNFRSINSTMGQHVGDQVLCKIAARWKTIADRGESGTLDFVTRQDSDEFSLIVRGFSTEEELLKTIECYAAALESKITVEECDFFVSACFGYAIYPDDASTVDSLISAAEMAMYETRCSDCNEHILRFTASMLQGRHLLAIEQAIRVALDNDEILFRLQPQYDIAHRLSGFEALARIQASDGSMISPADFIPVAEAAGLIDRIDSSVLRKSARFFGELIKKTDMPLVLSVNVSVRHMMKNSFLDELMETLDTCGIPANRLMVEITESIMIDSTERALQCINEIRALGVGIAIDDFGTGYSSLSYLDKYPIDLLKVDKSFVDKLNHGGSSKQYMSSIIAIGHVMGCDVIAEGIENMYQLEILREVGCDYIQGYLWGRPMTPEEAGILVAGEKSAHDKRIEVQTERGDRE